MFNGPEAPIPQPLPSGVKNEAKPWLWGWECKGMKTSSVKALGHPKPHSPPSPAPHSRGADSSEAPPGWGGKEDEESGEAPPRKGVGKRRPAPRGPRRPGWVPAARGGARPHLPASVVSLSPGAPHSASSSQSAQRADVPMVPDWMVPPPLPIAPHNKLPAFRKGGRWWGQGGRRGEEEGKELEGGKGSEEEEGTPSPTTCTISSPPATPPTYLPTDLPPLAAAAVQVEPAGRK